MGYGGGLRTWPGFREASLEEVFLELGHQGLVGISQGERTRRASQPQGLNVGKGSERHAGHKEFRGL